MYSNDFVIIIFCWKYLTQAEAVIKPVYPSEILSIGLCPLLQNCKFIYFCSNFSHCVIAAASLSPPSNVTTINNIQSHFEARQIA